MPLLDFVKNLTQREKTKTKKRSDDNMYITKTKEVKIPLEGDMTKIVTKKVKRPTVLGKLGDVEDKKQVTRDVRYESNSEKEMLEEAKQEPMQSMMREYSDRELKKPLYETAKTKDVDKVKKAINNKK